MMFGNVTGTDSNVQSGYSGLKMQTDSVSKNIQNQIVNAQKKLQSLSSNEEMAMEEKMKRRQEIQKEIAALNQQLRQHQIAQRKDRQTNAASNDDMFGEPRRVENSEEQGIGLSQVAATVMISADSAMRLAKVQGEVAGRMEGKAGVLETEIKLDKGRGASVERKEEELAELQAKAQSATDAQISTLADADKTMREAAEADQLQEPSESEENGTVQITGTEETPENESA